MLFYIYIGYLVLVNVITLFIWQKDKALAQTASRANRIKEKTMLGLTAMGGAIGALLGSLLFRHKTNKIYFTITTVFSLMCVIAVIASFIML